MEAFIRETKRKTLSLLHSAQAAVDRKRVNAYLKNYDASVIENQSPAQTKTILFVVTRMVRFHGGQTSILRLGTELSKLGYSVYYGVYKNQSRDEMEICARSNLETYQGKLISSSVFRNLPKKKKFDVVVATSWDTVSLVKKFDGYKMYFVQDYEPYFYPFGELFLMAKKTYEQGLHMVSLGSWNKDMIERDCHPVSPVDVIDFPYEKSEYPKTERDYMSYSVKKHITIAVYLKYYGKRLPCIIPYMLTNVQKMFAADGITLEVMYFGEAKGFTSEGGTNLGMLNKREMLNLYHTADFGMVASMSNISLIPYEMLATGLPLIEFTDGTFEYFFPKQSAVMTSIDPKDLYEKLKNVLQSPEQLVKMQENAAAYMQNLSWSETGKQFSDIMESL